MQTWPRAGITKIRVLLLCALLQSCALQGPVLEQAPSRVDGSAAQTGGPGELWWALRFRHHWPEQASPDFSRDLLLAHALLAPLIRDFEPVLGYWRFHRRAARDAAGHQFSLIFFASADVAYEMNLRLLNQPLMQKLLADGLLEKAWLDDRSFRDRAGITGSSDPHWSPRLQQAWPAFIQGVSKTWLLLVDAHMDPAAVDNPGDLDELAAHYRRADEEIRVLWQEQGQHAFLHHLSALFGYQPLLIRY